MLKRKRKLRKGKTEKEVDIKTRTVKRQMSSYPEKNRA